MLTKGDAKIIGDVFDKKFDEKFDEKFDDKFDKRLDARLEQTLDKKLDEKLTPIHNDVKIIKKDVRKLQKDVNGVINMADKGLLKVQKRVVTIEKHLGFPKADFA
jgi:hypothetical protein